MPSRWAYDPAWRRLTVACVVLNAAAFSGAAKGQDGREEDTDTVVGAKSEFSVYGDTDAVTVFTPAVSASAESPLEGWSLEGSYLADIVSAASVDIVSTASGRWEEVRHAGSLRGAFKAGAVGGTLSGSVSHEPDHLALSAGGALNVSLAQSTVNPSVSYAYTHETAGRTGTPFSVFGLPLVRHSGSAGIELILDPSTLMTVGVDGIFEVGDQSKPYRFLPLFAPDVAPAIPPGASVELVNRLRLPGRVSEHVPETRNRLALSARVAQRLSGSTVVLAERLYADTWGLEASTTDLRFIFDVGQRVFPWVHLRGHFQSAVTFWRRAYTAVLTGNGPLTVPRFRTGDRELGPIQTGTYGVGARFNVGPAARPAAWSLIAQADVMTTFFSDTLFIQTREAYLGVLELEAEF